MPPLVPCPLKGSLPCSGPRSCTGSAKCLAEEPSRDVEAAPREGADQAWTKEDTGPHPEEVRGEERSLGRLQAPGWVVPPGTQGPNTAFPASRISAVSQSVQPAPSRPNGREVKGSTELSPQPFPQSPPHTTPQDADLPSAPRGARQQGTTVTSMNWRQEGSGFSPKFPLPCNHTQPC